MLHTLIQNGCHGLNTHTKTFQCLIRTLLVVITRTNQRSIHSLKFYLCRSNTLYIMLTLVKRILSLKWNTNNFIVRTWSLTSTCMSLNTRTLYGLRTNSNLSEGRPTTIKFVDAKLSRNVNPLINLYTASFSNRYSIEIFLAHSRNPI